MGPKDQYEATVGLLEGEEVVAVITDWDDSISVVFSIPTGSKTEELLKAGTVVGLTFTRVKEEEEVVSGG